METRRSPLLLGVLLIVPVTACLVLGCGQEPLAIKLCKQSVERQLKSPASAQYLKVKAEKDLLASFDGGTFFEVSGQVDSANSYGALLRNEFACIVDFGAPDNPAVQAFVGDNVQLELLRAANEARDKYRNARQTSIRRSKQKETGRRPPDVVSYMEFRRLYKGQSLKEVQKIIGHDGAPMASNDQRPLLERIQAQPKITYQKWTNYDGSSLTVQFQDDKATNFNDDGLW